MDFSPAGRVCSFCGAVGTDDSRFAGGLGAMMCADCVARYHEIFSTDGGAASIAYPPWEEMSDDDLLATLPRIGSTAEQADAFMHDFVVLIRQRQLSWARIGAALGTSRQAAWERFGRGSAAEASDDQ